MKKNTLICILTAFLITLFICLIFIIPAINNRISTDEIQLEHLITDKSVEISEAISIPVNQLYTVASYIERNNGQLDNIEDFAATIFNNKYIRNLIIAPDCVVKQIYPDTEENKKVIGLDYYKDTSEGNREAILAATNRELLLAGPFTTVVGDKALSGRLPVNLTSEDGEVTFWGIISITLKYPEILNNINFDSLSKQGYTYELWHINVDTCEREVINSNGVINSDSNYIDKEISVLNAKWHLRLSPLPKWYDYTETWIYISLTASISFMVAIMFKKNIELNDIKHKLEIMVDYDNLTKIYNRHGLFRNLENNIKRSEEFLVYFIDLNDFKGINDKYGHNTGDNVLTEFVHRINLHIDSDKLFARMGGDEFLLLQLAPSTKEEMDEFWKKIYKEFEAPIVKVKNEDIYLTFSKGVASYTPDKDVLDDVIAKADKMMYKEKDIFHKKHKI